ncbi:MAG: glycosyltransferase [Pseudomonadota bacterium]
MTTSHAGTVFHLITTLHTGGTERQLVELLRALDGSRWQCRVATLRPSGQLLPEVLGLGIEPVPLPLPRTLVHPWTPGVILGLAVAIRRQQAVLLHCHDYYSALVGVPAARAAGVPVIVARRDLSHHLDWPHRLALRIALHQATLVLVNALAVADQVRSSYGVPSAKLVIVPNGINVTEFLTRAAAPPTPPLEAGAGTAKVLTIARLTHAAKGHDDLLQAIAILKRSAHPVHFFLAGDGPREPELRETCARLGIQRMVSFLGYRHDAPALLAQADIVCHPSRQEGLPNAVLEAMAAGRPVVATRAGGTAELIEDGKNGILVPPACPTMLADAIVRLLCDRVAASRLGTSARARVAKEFTVERLAGRIDAIYGALSSTPSPSLSMSGLRPLAARLMRSKTNTPSNSQAVRARE